MGHFVRLEAIWFYTVGKLIRSPCGAGCGPMGGTVDQGLGLGFRSPNEAFFNLPVAFGLTI